MVLPSLALALAFIYNDVPPGTLHCIDMHYQWRVADKSLGVVVEQPEWLY